MGTKIVSYTINSNKKTEDLILDVKTALRPLGGILRDFGLNNISLSGGKEGISFGFLFDIDANIKIVDLNNNKFDIQCEIKWKPNIVYWLCLVLGFFVLVTWLLNIAYAVMDPSKAYMEILYRLQSDLQ